MPGGDKAGHRIVGVVLTRAVQKPSTVLAALPAQRRRTRGRTTSILPPWKPNFPVVLPQRYAALPGNRSWRWPHRAVASSSIIRVRAKRDALAPSHPEWRRLSAELRSVEAELGDYGAAIAALGDEVQAEMRETAHAHRVAQHAQAMQAAEQADATRPRSVKSADWQRVISQARCSPAILRGL